MTVLLDHIFKNLEATELDRAQIVAYVRYLDELIRNDLPMEKELEYQAIKLRLFSRMNGLNREQLKFYRQDKEGEAES